PRGLFFAPLRRALGATNIQRCDFHRFEPLIMSLLDDLAFGPSGGRKAWLRGLLIALAALAAVAALLYYTVSGDYAFLRASILTGSPTGAYHALGDKLAARAHKKNGHLKVVATAGSVENIARLVGENGVCVPAFAFVQ